MKFLFVILCVGMYLSILTGTTVHAQSQSLSVTPPLFQISIEPKSVVQSMVRVINPNDFPLTVYSEIVNFVPDGEQGTGMFVPVIEEEARNATIAEWIEMPAGPFVIPEGQTQEIPFYIEVPEDAAPGGHFAAILISTEPPETDAGPLALKTTQTVTSLFFARIEGDVRELADIREFSVTERSIELPEAEFSLRFQNKGNVQVQPKGTIIISNMWGTERGIIPVNHDTLFGNVLPGSTRDFRFLWKGEQSLADIGRYKAVATLAYGQDGVQSVSAITYFWVIPITGTLITLISLAAIISLITWMIRLYIRRMLMLAGVDPDTKESVHEHTPVHVRRRTSITAPLTRGTLDLRQTMAKSDDVGFVSAFRSFVLLYKRFFIAVLLLGIAGVMLSLFIREVSNTETSYEVTIVENDGSRVLSDEDVEAE